MRRLISPLEYFVLLFLDSFLVKISPQSARKTKSRSVVPSAPKAWQPTIPSVKLSAGLLRQAKPKENLSLSKVVTFQVRALLRVFS